MAFSSVLDQFVRKKWTAYTKSQSFQSIGDHGGGQGQLEIKVEDDFRYNL